MKVKARFSIALEVTREVEIDDEDFAVWLADPRHASWVDHDLATAAYLESDDELMGGALHDWRTSEPLPSDFEVNYVEVVDAEPIPVAS